MDPRISVITLGVRDLPRAIRFYRDGLKFPTSAADDASIAFFMTTGTRFALYPLDKLAEDVAPGLKLSPGGFGGVTLGHIVRRREDVAATLAFAEAAGGRIVKPAQDVFWGGHSGYFSDPDGYFWEVAWGPMTSFAPDGSITITTG
jgi:catechol 2,3-dioxygenase-like lactoylglutathione lyase family enzyme